MAAESEAAQPGRWPITEAPLFEIRIFDQPLDLGDETLLFTSANGVRAFLQNSPRRDLTALCAGVRTTEAAEAAGLTAKCLGDTVDALAFALIAAPPPTPMRHICGRHVTGDLPGRLRAAGLSAEATPLYNQVALPLDPAIRSNLTEGRFDTVILMSPRTARLFAEAVGPLPQTLRLLCLSEAVAQPVRALGADVSVAAEPRQPSLLAIL